MADKEARFEERVELAVKRRTAANENALAIVEQFEAESGITFGEYSAFTSKGTEVGRITKAIMESGIDRSYNGLHAIADMLRKMSDQLEKVMIEQGLERKSSPPEAAIRGRRR